MAEGVAQGHSDQEAAGRLAREPTAFTPVAHDHTALASVAEAKNIGIFFLMRLSKRAADKSLEPCFRNQGMLTVGGTQSHFTRQHRNSH